MKRQLQEQDRFKLFEDCVGILDRTFIAFKNRPNWDPTIYTQFFNHKKARYGLHATVVCNDLKEFIDFSARWGGAVHDAHALKISEIGENSSSYITRYVFIYLKRSLKISCWYIFIRSEYVLADLEYQIITECIVVSKKTQQLSI